MSFLFSDPFATSDLDRWIISRDNATNFIAGIHALRQVKGYTLANAKCIVDDSLAILGVGRYDKGLFYDMTMEDVCILLDV